MLSKVSYRLVSTHLLAILVAFEYYYFFADIGDFRLWKPESISSIVAFPTIANRMSATIGTSLCVSEFLSLTHPWVSEKIKKF